MFECPVRNFKLYTARLLEGAGRRTEQASSSRIVGRNSKTLKGTFDSMLEDNKSPKYLS